jgi:hypothetical protein
MGSAMINAPANSMTQSGLKRELVIAATFIGGSLLLLPFAIYFVGRQGIGEYAADAGALDLAEQIWWDLMQLSPAAWTLVLTPYLLIQLIRLARRTWRYATL